MPDEQPSTEDTSTTDTPAPESGSPASDPAPGPETPETHQDRRDANVRAERDQFRTERDALSGRVAAMQRAEVHRRAAEHVQVPGDLDLVTSPEEYAACFTESGDLDEGTLGALLDRVTTERPNWRKGPTSGSMDMGYRQTAPVGRTPTWDGAFK